MRRPIDMLFVPSWLDNIQPVNPVDMIAYAGAPVYPPSRLTAHIITPASLALQSTGSEEWHGYAFCSGEIVDSASRSREAQAARAARKTARAAEMGRVNRMDARAERRAAREARRIMMDIRRRLTDAFTMTEE
jgi:hypothetical protein